ncbi:unnamed protein product [Malassezia sympodialis ATCC 42132]|uniref:Similar to S.cerevisiae protein TUP1 (General repressor of transcription) n=1 Tax=Malassezia sympodialis (strain ATCC 42132) TaxID=1230383 RepID=M5E8L5_MALS4|nr:uncharacterized protein MSY001_1205 [Malassezia sympodialis ATCC 42132]CCU98499.1 unnamed protein product [Malassezia sympodialis ATCC 42132]SHO79294.1 Similar to S.cerevisiae protein TUP1 (General repressor of transcription) [Malassezia sympodialis ATCC 42132]|eukprot:XP_018739803.1 uncharacterized protein MSY001_1205 [Malassezia sympodialis ATCC 42132]
MEEAAIASGAPTSSARYVRGTVSPRRASRFFLPRDLNVPLDAPPSPTRTGKAARGAERTPLALRRRSAVGRQALHASARRRLPYELASHAYLASFHTDADAPYQLDSGCIPHGYAAPLSASYMHRACAAPGVPQLLAVGDDEGRVHLLDTLVAPAAWEPRALRHSTQPLIDGSLFAMAWRPDDAALALGGSDYSVSVWDVEREQCLATYDAHRGSPRALAWDPAGGGQVLCSGARDGAVYVWDVRQASPAMHLPEAHRARRARRRAPAHDAVTSVAYLPSGLLATAGSSTAAVRVWEPRMARAVQGSADLSREMPWNTRPHGVSSLAVAASRGRMYAACTDGCIYVLDTSDVARALPPGEARALWAPAQRHNTLYARLALYEDRLLALGCNSGDVVLWDTQAAHAPAAGREGAVGGGHVVPRAHEAHAEVNAVAWSRGPRGPTLASASDDGTLRTWRAA